MESRILAQQTKLIFNEQIFIILCKFSSDMKNGIDYVFDFDEYSPDDYINTCNMFVDNFKQNIQAEFFYLDTEGIDALKHLSKIDKLALKNAQFMYAKLDTDFIYDSLSNLEKLHIEHKKLINSNRKQLFI